MSPGQSARNGNSVEPGLPNTFLMPRARSRLKVASLTVMDFVASGFSRRTINGPPLVRQTPPRPACGERYRPPLAAVLKDAEAELRLCRIVRCDPGEGDSPRVRMRGCSPSPQPSPREERGEGAYCRSQSPRCHALHGRLSFRIRGPDLHAPTAIIVGIDRELAALEQRLHAAIDEF